MTENIKEAKEKTNEIKENMVENMYSIKESTSLKEDSRKSSEIYEIYKNTYKKEPTSKFEISLTIIFILIFVCVVVFFLFADDLHDYFKSLNDNQNNKILNNQNIEVPIEEVKEKKKKKNKHRFNEDKKTEKKEKKCKEGYYKPTNGPKCKKCSIENCLDCSGDKKHDVCNICKKSFKPIYDKNKQIKSCTKACETGKDEKCLKCKKNKCSDCNTGYKLMAGKCILNHSIKAIFKTNKKSLETILMNKKYEKNIIELIIDDKEVKPSYKYTFNKNGKHIVFILINTLDLDSVDMMFFNEPELISIAFTKKFETTNLLNMKGMFKDCINLESIDLSYFKAKNTKDFSHMLDNCNSLSSINLSKLNAKKAKDISYLFKDCTSLKYINLKKFDTSKVVNMEGLFIGCSQLTSIDLKNFNTKEVKKVNKIFYGCNKLNKVDISSLNHITWDMLFDKKASKSGEIIIKKSLYKELKNKIPSKWKLIKSK